MNRDRIFDCESAALVLYVWYVFVSASTLGIAVSVLFCKNLSMYACSPIADPNISIPCVVYFRAGSSFVGVSCVVIRQVLHLEVPSGWTFRPVACPNFFRIFSKILRE